MTCLGKFSIFIDALNERVGRATSYCTFFMVIITVIDVLLRYLFRAGSVGVQELEWHLFGFVFLLGAAYTLLKDEHVRVDIFYARRNKRGRAWVNLIGSIIFCLPVSFVIIWTSLPFVLSSWQFLEGSPDPGGLPARYILKSAIPVGFFLVALQSISIAIKSLEVILTVEQTDKTIASAD
ncbi:MAG: TRAP transporter small permease subunit [Nitrospinaceae bacterium]|jgi:TRAP-type mannitol/chloroaromatic compound transport system permease small subunit|nr:TRAP transporter small permease subunit [Nitrospinaceae bacterium]MBT3434695.1 TRAP transporter small permease subunit [Nitrospinaceae bacterium]MBT3822983.1 TRAP transporter small permease subunit [Nitrospinaceae bacterium]MBT4095185.1 TRAP transporter small permease subunit [Nitrospinaceae bacterium]MBT4430105.1 TRAP transporter small permease subunit [Nitrospinaceae bacterium]